MTATQIQALTALVVAVGGLLTAGAAAWRAVRTNRTVQAHLTAHLTAQETRKKLMDALETAREADVQGKPNDGNG